jgi:hypothetical protein
MARMALVPADKLKSWQLIIRCIHQRGADQARCLVELGARGLWLNDEQKAQAGLTEETAA